MNAPNAKNAPNAIIAATMLAALALACAFFAQRGADVGALGVAASNVGAALGRTDGNAADLLNHLIGAGFGLLIVGAWFGLGAWCEKLPFLNTDEPAHKALVWARRGALGAGAWSLLWLGLGKLNLYRPGVAWAALVLGIFGLVGYISQTQRNPAQNSSSLSFSALLQFDTFT